MWAYLYLLYDHAKLHEIILMSTAKDVIALYVDGSEVLHLSIRSYTVTFIRLSKVWVITI